MISHLKKGRTMENEKLEKMHQGMKEKQSKTIKSIVQQTFERIAKLEVEKAALQEQIRILKHDLFDFKDGRLDRILERHDMNHGIKKISVIDIVKTNDSSGKDPNPWYIDYSLLYSDTIGGEKNTSITINNSLSKMHASGAYKLSDGVIRYL